MRDSTTNHFLALQERNVRKGLEGREVSNTVELAREGILGATKLFPGVITEFDLVIHYKPILEMFAVLSTNYYRYCFEAVCCSKHRGVEEFA